MTLSPDVLLKLLLRLCTYILVAYNRWAKSRPQWPQLRARRVLRSLELVLLVAMLVGVLLRWVG